MAGPNMDQFDAYFRRADLDGDGKISGAEAVAFFQGSNLHKQVLAQIWMHADQSRSGFLGRAEFYNALKLVTVAQSKRELTPEIVKAALYGPAAAKIPAPQINLAAVPAPQASSMAAPQIGMPASVSAQSPGIRPQGVPTVGMNPNYFPSQQNQFMRPAQPIPPVSGPRPPQTIAPVAAPRPPQMISPAAAPHLPQASMMGSSQATPTGTAYRPATQSITGGAGGLATSTSGSTTDWLGGRSGGSIPGAGPRGASPTSGLQQLTPSPMSSQSIVSDSKAIVSSGNASASTSSFGDDMFSVTPSTQKQEPPKPTYSAANASPTTALAPVSSMGQGPIKSNSLGSLQDAFFQQSLGGLQRAQSLPTIGQQVSASSSSLPASPATSVGLGSALDNNSQPGWPKMKAAEIQKYTKVFMEVDTDRDGKITGEQARTLFLSWRLPREVLKQVWDLSDQDSDSMLSLREFCFALYLMERFREGRPLPPILPRNVMFDETLMSMTGQPKVAYGNAAWAPGAGFAQQPGMGPRPPMGPAPGLRPPAPVPGPQHDVAAVSSQNNSGSHVLDDSFLSRENGDSGNAMLQNGTAEKKAEGAEKLILDSREKIEYFRSKMQDLVLYKSRCDNRLNEITERALADKREAEILGKKYEEKYKQVAEVASKLTIEEAQFRDIQERKKELHQAIVNMEQGGSADGLLQVRADRIQSDLDELTKVLIERSKKHSLDIKSTAMVELPFGWQPGIQENAAPWDEEWDKFEDEGFGHDLTIDVKNVSETANGKANAVQNGIASPDGSLTPDSLSNGDAKSGNFRNIHDHEHNLEENESAYAHSEVESVARSPQGSPAGRTPSRDFSDVFAKSTEGDSEAHRSFDDSAWGAAFDSNDDVDSVWGFNPASAKDTDSEKHQDFFGGEDFGIKPIRTSGSPTSTTTDHIFQKKSIFFEESVAGSPMSRFANSPRFSEAGDQFDSFSRFDSFSMQEGSGFSPQKATLSRFDSINSSKDFGGGGGGYDRSFSSFDDADPFGSSEPFKVSTSSDHHHSPKKSSDNWNAF